MNNKFIFSDIFIKGEAQYGFWGFVNKGIGVFNTLLTIWSLNPYQYGVFQLFLSLRAFFSDFISISAGTVNNELLRFIGEKKEDHAKRIFIEYTVLRLSIGCALFLLFFLGAPYLNFRYEDNFIEILRVLSFLFLIDALMPTIQSLIIIRMHFGSIVSRGSIEKAVQFLVLLYFFSFSHIGVFEVLVSFAVGAFLSMILLVSRAREAYSPWRNIRQAEGRFLFLDAFRVYGKWEFLKTVASKLTARIQPWLIKFFVSTEAVGIYSIAVAMVSALKSLMLTNTVGVLIPQIIHDTERTKNIFFYLTKYLFITSIFLMIGGALFAPIAVAVIFPAYSAALPFFYGLLCELPIQALVRTVDPLLVGLRRQRFIFLRTVSRTVLSLALLLVLLPVLNLWGVVVSYLLYVYLLAIAGYAYLVRIEPAYRFPAGIMFSITETDRIYFKTAKDKALSFLRKFIYH